MNDLKIKVIENNTNDVLVGVEGFIDTVSSKQFGDFVIDVHNNNPHKKIIIDFNGVEMLTSAGIRYLLQFHKDTYNYKLINVRREVYTVLQLTGMSEILDVEQKTISINTKGCKVLGKGFHSEVYKLDNETIAKVYYDIPNIDMAIRERMIAKQAFVKGVPTEISFGLCEAEGRPGLVYELVDADTLLNRLTNDFEHVEKYIKEYVDLVKEVHKFDGDGISGIYNKKDVFYTESAKLENYLPEECYKKLRKVGDDISYSNNLLHGDPHPANVMLTNRGMIFIDLSDMGIGDEKFDLMYLYRTLKLFSILPDSTYALNKEQCFKLWDLFVSEYYKDCDIDYVNRELKTIKILALNSIAARFVGKNPNSDASKLFLNMLIEELQIL